MAVDSFLLHDFKTMIKNQANFEQNNEPVIRFQIPIITVAIRQL